MTVNGGRIVVLNGPSSSGKSTTIAAFQRLMPGPWWHTGMDALSAMLTPDEAKRAMCGVPRFVSALHRFVADLARHEHDVVYETGLIDAGWVDDMKTHFQGLPVLLVGVTCPLEEVARREAARGDRPTGYSATSYNKAHAHLTYDLILDSAALDATQRAQRIVEALRERDPDVTRS